MPIKPTIKRIGKEKPRQMTLGEQQEIFSELFAKLILYIISLGYFVRLGEVQRTKLQAEYYASHCASCKRSMDAHQTIKTHVFKPIGISKSRHIECTAGDLKIMKRIGDQKIYLTDSKDYKIFGEWWKKQHPLCKWGGDIISRPDGGHFSFGIGSRI